MTTPTGHNSNNPWASAYEEAPQVSNANAPVLWKPDQSAQPGHSGHGQPQQGHPQSGYNHQGYAHQGYAQQGYGAPGAYGAQPGQAMVPYPQPGYGPGGYGQPIYVQPLKSCGIAYLLWFFTAGFGGHHWYAGRTGSAVGMIVLTALGYGTIWLLGLGFLFLVPLWIWQFVDLFLIPSFVREANARMTGFAQPF